MVEERDRLMGLLERSAGVPITRWGSAADSLSTLMSEAMDKVVNDGRLADAIFDSSSVLDRLSHGRDDKISIPWNPPLSDGWHRPYNVGRLRLKWML